jgi:hypothetical protein
LVTFRSGTNISQPVLYSYTVSVPCLRATIDDPSIAHITAAVCPADPLDDPKSCNGPALSVQFSLYSVIVDATVVLLSSSSAAISVALSETSGPRLPQFFSVSISDISTNTVLNSFVGAADTTMTFFGMQPLQSYRCFIRSMDGQGRVLPVSYSSAAFTALIPPTSFAVSSLNSTSVTALWNHPAGSAVASFYSLVAVLEDGDLSSSVNVSAPSAAGPMAATIAQLMPLRRYQMRLIGFNVLFSNHSSTFAVSLIRPTHPPACVPSVKLFMMPSATPHNFYISWSAPASFVSSDPVYTAGFSVQLLLQSGLWTPLLNRSPASTAVIPLTLSAGDVFTVRIATVTSIDGALIDGPFCMFNLSVGAVPQLTLKDSHGNSLNNTVNSLFPGQVMVVSFSSFHADIGESLSLSTTGKPFSFYSHRTTCNTTATPGIDDQFAFLVSSLNALPYGSISGDCSVFVLFSNV